MTGFASMAEIYALHGVAVVPFGDDKRPLVRCRRLTKEGAFRLLPTWLEKFSDANLGLLCGPSKLTVIDIDADDAGLFKECRSRFGETPFIARTPRGGSHLYYRSSGERTRVRVDGLPLDIRGLGGFVVAPPSSRADGGRYEIAVGHLNDLEHLPPVRDAGVVDRNCTTKSPLKEGERNAILWRVAMVEARSATTEDELLARVLILNEARCKPPLDHDEVCRLVESAWGYEQRGQNWIGQGGRVYLDSDEIEAFVANPDALALLVMLRKKHLGQREQFPVSPRWLADQGPISGWTERRIRKARDELIAAGAIARVHAGGRGQHDPAAFCFRVAGEDSVSRSVCRNRTTSSTDELEVPHGRS